jgi:alkane 1-monooxygenase
VIYYIFGMKALGFQILMSVVAIFMGEWINYIEHYGLARNKDKNGVYESITYLHSWNSYSTSLLFRI